MYERAPAPESAHNAGHAAPRSAPGEGPSTTGPLTSAPAWSGVPAPASSTGGDSDFWERQAEDVATQIIGPPTTPTGGSDDLGHGTRPPASAAAAGMPALQGEPLPSAEREFFERRLGHDLSRVRVHHDAAAARSAGAVSAEAYTVQDRIVFGQGRYAPGTRDGRRLLAHELTHVVQQHRSPQARGPMRRPGAPARSRAPFARTEKLLDQAASSLQELVVWLETLPAGTVLKARIAAVKTLAEGTVKEKAGATEVIDAWVAGEETPTTAPVDTLNYVIDDKPSKRGLETVERREANLLSLIDLVKPRVDRLTRTATALGTDTPAELRDAFEQVADHYLDLLPHSSGYRVFQDLRFLDTYYRDPRVIQGYGLWAYVRAQLPDLYENVLRSMQGSTVSFPMGSTLKSSAGRIAEGTITRLMKGGRRAQKGARTAQVLNSLIDLKSAEERIGTPPASLDEAGTQWDAASNGPLIRLVIDLQVRVAILHLWQAIEPLQDLLNETNNAGQSILPFTTDERSHWFEELNDLDNQFVDEMKLGDHPGIDTKIEGWTRRLLPLVKKIPSEVRTKKIIAAIVGQLPFMFVAGATAARVGLWVRAATQSKWLVALAEGSTFTLFNAAAMPAGSSQRPTTLLGWTGNLAVNVLLSRAGRAFVDVGMSLSRGRSAILVLSAQVVAPTVALSGLQTGVQLIEAKLRGAGGETGLTELLTVNLLLNGIGMVMGAAATPSSAGGTALARPGVVELARQLGIPEGQARLLMETGDRMADFMAAVADVNRAAERGALSPAQFEAMRKQGLDLATFLETHCEPLATAGAFGDVTPAQVSAGIAGLRTRISGLTFASLAKVRALLPEATGGLVRVGESEQWAYNRDRPPTGLKALREGYMKAGDTVTPLLGDGFEVRDPAGLLVAGVVPMRQQALEAMTPSLTQLAKGPLAQEGLAKVRAQQTVRTGMLEAQLERAGSTSAGRTAVPRVLQHLARFVDADNEAAWAGLSNYLSLNGDVALLARATAYGSPREFAQESRALANTLLTQMSRWDADAVDGFAKLYAVRPNLTAERLHSLLADFEPVQVTGVLQSLSLLAPRSHGLGKVIGPLTSGAESSRRGAMGALTTGVQLADKHPHATLVFEDPVFDEGGGIVRITDISVQEQQTTRVAGVERTTVVEIAAVEVKEVSTSSLGRRAPQELARDIARDSRIRAQRVAPAAGSRPFFETFTWRIRRTELRQRAINALADPAATEKQIDAKMRQLVQGSLRKALDRPEFRALPAAEQDGYRRAFDGVPFVEFF